MRSTYSYSKAELPSYSSPALYDKWFIFIVGSIVLIGLLMMSSASIDVSDKQVHSPFYFLLKQLVYLTIGVFIGGLVLQMEIRTLESLGATLLLVNLVLLTAVLIPGIGKSVNGSARWLGYRFLSFQVSELTKLLVVIYMAGYLVRHQEVLYSVKGVLRPLGVMTLIAILLLKEPDFGATVVVTVTTFGMLFLAGMRLRYFVWLLLFAAFVLGFLAISAPYRLIRLTSFMDPWAHPFDSGYQLTQSLIAFGRGGWFGLGLGNSIQKLFYLPEAHTDFLFAVIVEELGLFGAALVVALFSLLVIRVFKIGRDAELLHRHFEGYMAYGFGFWLFIQFAVSIGVNCGLLPTKGLTLPLMSYGGSSVVASCIMIALLLRIDHENRQQALGFR